MANTRYYNLGTSSDYAKAHGISVRTAQKRMSTLPGSLKTSKGWRVPILSTEYAKIKGVSAKKARQTAVQTSSPSSLLLKAQIPSTMDSRSIVPWKKVAPQNMFGLGRVSSHQYSYQGVAIVKFKTSGDVVEVWSHLIGSSIPLTYRRLKELIIDSVKKQLGTSPYDILSVSVVRAKSTHARK